MPFQKFANVSKHRLLTRGALIGAATVRERDPSGSFEYAIVFLKLRTKLAARLARKKRLVLLPEPLAATSTPRKLDPVS
jgi:hypothetical protein